MMGLSGWHMIFLLVVVLVVWGPSRLPNLGRSVGEAIRGFKKGMEDDGEIDVTHSVRRESLDETKADPYTQTQKQKKNTDV